MKKIFTLIVVAMMAVTTQAAVTIYVKADVAPYLWAWNSQGNIFSVSWPGVTMTDFSYVQGTKFWTYTFGDEVVTPISIIFNDGNGKQTGNITGITTDHYFTYDGATSYEDVTEQYGGVIPDADIEMVTLAGPFNSWNSTSNVFTEVKHNAKYTYEWDIEGIDDPTFKVVVNGSDWLGFWSFGDSQERLIAPELWVMEGADSENMMFDTTMMPGVTKVLFTAEWVVGKKADQNWTLTITDATTGINAITTTTTKNSQRYNLAGQKVGNSYKGIVIQNGKKFIQK
ncbi:MAG: starch-binding protein [Prevotella sp.]|nr:starch-binding protein [Prevotella sp.]